ncbi:MAG TPA: hypothetical protein ENK05_09525 [Gammaproteobacteria bacterium]|nr:hypothetical protein [Gammaproteobacteria bacterium]
MAQRDRPRPHPQAALHRPDRWLARKLQRYSVNLPPFTHQRLADSGEIEEIAPGIWAQTADTLYDPELGLVLEPREIAADKLVI